VMDKRAIDPERFAHLRVELGLDGGDPMRRQAPVP
jgi:hypothetical protein